MLTRISIFFLLISSVQSTWAQNSTLYSEFEIVVGLHNNQSDLLRENTNQKIAQLSERFGQADIRQIGPPEVNTFAITFNQSQDIPTLIEAYQASGLFRYVEPNYYGYGGGQKAAKSNLPNDTHFGRQYGLVNDGSFSLGTVKEDADVDMELAWEIETGDSQVVVAVLDAGAKMDHPELVNRLWHNSAEAENNADDDMNGYIDDVLGWDFVNNDNDPTDDHGHGTNVVGIVGADANNNLGYSGVDQYAKLMICKILDSENRGFYSWWTTAIYYAVNQGAKVINMSVGGSSFSQAMEDAVNYAHNKGVTIVACMMNNNNNVTYYPAGYVNTIAVGATNPDDTRAAPFFWSANSGSSFGGHIDVVAPGNYIYGLSHRSDSNFGSYWGGTSQATPLVAGIAALLIAQDSSRGPEDIRTILQSTAEDQIGNPFEDTEGFDIYYGYGRVNAHQALMQLPLSNGKTAQSTPTFSIYPNPVADELIIKSSIRSFQLDIYNHLGQLVLSDSPDSEASGMFRIKVNTLSNGHYFVIQRDHHGRRLSSSNVVVSK
jgi:thermitase